MKTTYGILGVVGLGIFGLILSLIYFGAENPFEVYGNIGTISAIFVSLGGVYIIIRAILILAADVYLPSIKLFGGIVLQCVTLTIVGIIIGLLAPIWSVIIYFVGSGFGFLTNAFEGA